MNALNQFIFYEMLIAHAQCRRHEVLREHTKGMAPYPLGTCDLKQFRSQFVTICSICDSVYKTKPPIQASLNSVAHFIAQISKPLLYSL